MRNNRSRDDHVGVVIEERGIGVNVQNISSLSPIDGRRFGSVFLVES